MDYQDLVRLAKQHGIAKELILAWRPDIRPPNKVAAPPRSKRDHFMPQMIALLGKRTDSKLARNFKIPKHSIQRKRKELGVASYAETHRHEWTAAEIAALGEISDKKAAKRCGLSAQQVRRERLRRGIPPYSSKRAVAWQTVVPLLGKVKDREIAARMNVTVTAVRIWRKKLGITQYSQNRWTKAWIRKLGTASDKDVAKELGLHWRAVQRKRQQLKIPPKCGPAGPVNWTPEMLENLRSLGNADMKRKYGMSPDTVASVRKRLGLTCPLQKGKVAWTDEMSKWVGTDFDGAIGKRLGISDNSVRTRRLQLGIPAFTGFWNRQRINVLGQMIDKDAAGGIGQD